MAIGSTPEIGSSFGLLREMTDDDLTRWWNHMRTNWHPNLLNGYATIIHRTTNNPYYEKREPPHDRVAR